MNHLKKLYKALKVNNNMCGKSTLSLELQIKFDARFKVTSIPFFILDFNLLSCELDNFTLRIFLSHNNKMKLQYFNGSI